MPFLKNLFDDDIPTPFFRIYANASDRVADSPENAPLAPIAADDIILNRVALQRDNGSFWRPITVGPLDWVQVGGSQGGTPALPFDAITDPATDAAVTTVIIDANDGIVITLTAPGNSQTLAAPTDTTAGKDFVVVNNDTSTDPITVNGAEMGTGSFLKFHWDGTAWIALSVGAGAASPGGPTNAIQRNGGGVFSGNERHTFDPATNIEQVLGDIVQQGGNAANQYTPTVDSTTATGANPRDLSQQGDFLAVVDSNADDLRIFNLKAPGGPALVNLTPLVIGTLRGVDWPARYMVVTDTDSGGRLHVVDTLNKSDPQVVGTVVIGGSPRRVKVVGNIAYVVGNVAAQALITVDISNPAIPKILDTFAASFASRIYFDVADEIVYMVLIAPDFNLNFLALDVSDPTNITQVSAVDVGGSNLEAVQVQPPYAFILDAATRRLDVYDIADPNAITNTKVGTLQLEAVTGTPRNLILAEDFAYITDVANDDLKVVDISDPSSMFIVGAADVGANSTSLAGVGTTVIVLDNTEDVFRVVDVGGVKSQNVRTGNLSAANALIKKNLSVAGTASAAGMTVGASGINSAGEVSAGGRFLGGASLNLVEIFKEADFPDTGGLIDPAPGVTYLVMQPFTMTKKFKLPDTITTFDPSVIMTLAKYANIVTVNIASGFMLEEANAAGQIVLRNIRFESDGNAAFASVSGATQQSADVMLDNADIVGFADGTVFSTCIVEILGGTLISGSGAFQLIDCELLSKNWFSANFSDTGQPTLDIKSSAGSVIPSLISVRDSRLSSQANESFLMLHSNLIAGSSVTVARLEPSPFTPGTGSFFATLSGSITALQDSGGAPGVRTVVTSAGHDVVDGDTVTHAGFTTATQLNGTFVASDVGVNSYEVTAVFTVTDTGTWQNASLDQTDPKVTARNNPGQPDSATSAEASLSGNVNTTVIPAAGAAVVLNGGALWTSAVAERIRVNPDGSGDHLGLEAISVAVDGNAQLEPASSTKVLACQFLGIRSPTRIVTFTNATNLVNETTTPRSNGDVVIFRGNAGTLPAELRTDIAYYVVNQLANSFQLAYTAGGAAIAFSDDGTPTNTYKHATFYGSRPINTIASNNPRDLVPQALIPLGEIDEVLLTLGNDDDATDIDANQAYYRIR